MATAGRKKIQAKKTKYISQTTTKRKQANINSPEILAAVVLVQERLIGQEQLEQRILDEAERVEALAILDVRSRLDDSA